jgi:hypothetical protein
MSQEDNVVNLIKKMISEVKIEKRLGILKEGKEPKEDIAAEEAAEHQRLKEHITRSIVNALKDSGV